MARKKRRKRTRLTKQLQYELIGILFIFLSIFGSGASMISDGFIPTSLENIFRLLLGVWYFVASIILLVIGIILVIKRKFPTFFTKRKIGFLILFLGILLFTHIQTFEKLLIDTEETSIIKATWDHFIAFVNGEGVSSQLGGGLIGGILFAANYFLFSSAGAKIVAVFSLMIGFIFMTNLSIGNFYSKLKNIFIELVKKIKERREEKKATKAETTQASTENGSQTIEPPIEMDKHEPEEVDVQYSFEESTNGQLIIPMDDHEQEVEDEEMIEHMPNEIENGMDHYELPSPHLLSEPVKHTQQREKSQIQKTVQMLEQTFQSFGVKAKITKAHVGPAVTKYEVYPEAGVKVSRIISLQDDLALALAAQDIRIEAPIPGKSAVGIEVPNKEIATVSLSEALDITTNKNKKLLFALGKDISGEIVQGELNKMPHLLIAGATGSGKSVCINGIITSILMRAKPDEVKMMMIDPKKVELNVYNGIPHLLTPVVTDPKKASVALKKVVAEMEYRYELFSDTGTRNLEGYNNYMQRQNELTGEKQPLLPYIVVLVDELADLMMVASKDVEDSITRLAQMARAAGIHLIIATQRPSVDVITGIIKANIPSRIAFSVSSQVDSRTILDIGGAEKLLGRGDMLYIPVGMSKPIRVQGAFLSDEEVERVVTHCINEQKVTYQEEMIPEEQSSDMNEVDDELFDEAVQLVVEMQSASVSMLQRRFRIGYTRAARLIDAMEDRHIVGPYEGNKPRAVLLSQQNEESS
ncbi:DNA translocase FtsK [Pseudogracilibacillus auburnensis]|uniref:DNA translocase FtsK n=1 Tax=Pseudogracilibacillus auburnensis TaxID=1494959 RepID=A0A2V3W8T7_9BACI|nr:DNA translocase FtsK [Pseudogracilibacillus auburnensis]PXW88665.1 DNA translocase FtsK [Pseudogracilibacillus auburnensis]